MGQVYQDLTLQVGAGNQDFTITGEEDKHAEAIFLVHWNSTVIPQPCITELTPTSFNINFAPTAGDILEVWYLDRLSSVTINCNGVTNHILPVSAQVLKDLFVTGSILELQGNEACSSALQQIDASIATQFDIQASAISESEIFATAEICEEA